MATFTVPIGRPFSLVQNQVYALPGRAVYVFGGGTVELSNDGSTWTAIGTINPVSAAFIRNTGATALVTIKGV